MTEYGRPKNRKPVAARTFLFAALCFAFSAAVFPSFAEAAPAIVPSVAPGLYSAPQLVSFPVPDKMRLLVRIDSSPAFEPAGSVLLSAQSGEDREIIVDAELRPLDPLSPALLTARFVWRIDRKAPSEPSFSVKESDGGFTVTASIDEPGSVVWKLYSPAHRASATETVRPGGTVFIPSGTVACAYGLDSAGNRGPSAAPEFSAVDGRVPFSVVSPVPGTWSNPQVLLVDALPGTDVFYSLDGSDPAISGLDYSGPIQLDSTGKQRLRVFAIDSSGKRHDAEVSFTVEDRGADVPATLKASSGADIRGSSPATDTGLIETGSFGEIAIPEGFRWTLGDAVPENSGGQTVVFSGIRGMVRYEPLVVTDGKRFWRWVCSSGSTPKRDSAVPAPQSPAPFVCIHDWYFADILWNTPVYVSRDRTSWSRLEGPLLDERRADSVLYWYSDTWKSGEVQTLRLPAKPSITGVPANGVTANPVLLTLGSTPLSAHYEISATVSPRLPDAYSAALDDGVLFELPQGTGATFAVRLLCELDGVIHGELVSSFTIDRKIPATPVIGIPSALVWSRVPVSFSPEGEDSLRIDITPDSFVKDGNGYVLCGSENGPVTYAVSAVSVDRAGNASPRATKTVTVDLNALTVDAGVAVVGIRDGSPSAPFASLDDALDAVRGTGLWRITVKGTAALSRWHEMRSPVSIDARGAAITAVNQAGIRMRDARLAITGGTISYAGVIAPSSGLSRTPAFSGMLFDIRGGSFSLDGVTIAADRNSPAPLVAVTSASVSLTSCSFTLASGEYALLFSAEASGITARACSFAVRGDSVSAISLTSSNLTMDDCAIGLTPGRVGRAVECWGSESAASETTIDRVGGAVNRDTAFWYDGRSTLSIDPSVVVRGFWRSVPDSKK
jgi:hypothetical protein